MYFYDTAHVHILYYLTRTFCVAHPSIQYMHAHVFIYQSIKTIVISPSIFYFLMIDLSFFFLHYTAVNFRHLFSWLLDSNKLPRINSMHPSLQTNKCILILKNMMLSLTILRAKTHKGYTSKGLFNLIYSENNDTGRWRMSMSLPHEA
jgi:hypothetical protein